MSEVAARIAAYFEACNSGEAARIAEHFTEDAAIYDTNHGPVLGREAIGRFWASIAERWRPARWYIDTLVEGIDAAAIEWTMTGRHRDTPFTVRGSEHYEFAGGLIAVIRQYWTFDADSPGSELCGYPYDTDPRFAPRAGLPAGKPWSGGQAS